MHFSLLFVITCPILLILGAPSDYAKVQQQLTDVLQQLDRIELQFNNSITQVLEKIDENSRDIIIHLINSIHGSKPDSEFPFFLYLKKST